jgi:glycine cleavage system transcriptional repressor
MESRMTALGNEFATLMLVSGNWHTLAKLEGELAKLAETAGLTINSRRTEARPPRTDMVSYTVDVVCLDQPGVLWRIAQILSDAGISIEALIQKEAPEDQDTATMILLTSVTEERSMNEAIRAIEAQDATRGPVRRIRMEKLDG